MAYINGQPIENYGYDFVPARYLPPGKDEYWLRNRAVPEGKPWRNLQSREIEILIQNDNTCADWDNFLVRDPFDPSLVRNSHFYGLVRIGVLRKVLLQHNDFTVPAGIRNSTVISCDIGDDTAIQDCAYISHYVIGDVCILSRIDEMQATNHSKFGNGVLKDGEEESVRVWIDVMNEAGGRSILPFVDMTPADAFLWAAYRDDTVLVEKLKEITQSEYGGRRGAYGFVGSHTVIKSCRFIKDTYVGEWAYIKGANKLKNVSILSSEDEKSQIGEGVEMVNGIVGFGCSAFYGIKAVRFVMGRGSSLKYGARLIHSVLGDNSVVSCCELLNNLIFPCHEQHHNNSFLIASLVEGMSNIAAGATVGSNHNSRANDGEIRAGRGFWPALATTLKHSSRFASFVIIAKGHYPYELNISLPFSLVNNNTLLDRLELMPAYFWMYNLYALERNSWKTFTRDRRKHKIQRIESDYLAPDTVEEIIAALSQMEAWIKDAAETADNTPCAEGADSPAQDNEDPEYTLAPEDDALPASGLERHARKEVLLKPRKAMAAYREMLLYYSLKTLESYLEGNPGLSYQAFVDEMEAGNAERVKEWVNLGGQIAPAFRVDKLREEIRAGKINSWQGIHSAYDKMAALYPLDKARHAWEVYRAGIATAETPRKRRRQSNERTAPQGGDKFPAGEGEVSRPHPFTDPARFREELETLIALQNHIAGQVYRSRAKDYNDPYRSITYRNTEEMRQVVGSAEDNAFVKLIKERTKAGEEAVRKLLARLS